ncbi:22.7 kDa class IV heat shock protein [Vitis vinifera]|uniref:22.7 kDa class IV heat shock protein n=1 Tax=Vitis vinifera TaxID=29760 RepID=A0A438E9X8_VITVI|nr:22.7 kDa class IV heat shock protein [Vitis vinifera]
MELSRERSQKNTPENTIQSYKIPSTFVIGNNPIRPSNGHGRSADPHPSRGPHALHQKPLGHGPPFDDPFRILEHSPITVPRGLETIALARSDWKETTSAHIITLDVPGMKKEDIKIEIEENRVLRISGERTAEKEAEGEKWHRSERATGKFWRQFRLPANADLDRIKAHIENGVLRITIPKLAEDRKKQAKVVTLRKKPTVARMLWLPRVRCEDAVSLDDDDDDFGGVLCFMVLVIL